jgi:hypothetical protein
LSVKNPKLALFFRERNNHSMKHPILPLALCALVAAATTTSKKDLFDPEKYSAKPTWAIPG